MRDLLISPTVKSFLAANSRTCQKMLLECDLIEAQQNILISTKENPYLAHALTLRSQALAKAAHISDINHITIGTGSEVWCSLPVPIVLGLSSTIMSQSQQNTISSDIPLIFPLELYQELYSFPGSASALLFFDNSGIASNDNVKSSSGVSANKWLSLRHEDYWPKEELTNYKRRLLAEKTLVGYEYVAYLTTGEKCRFNVDARLARLRRDDESLIRIVKVNSCIPIE